MKNPKLEFPYSVSPFESFGPYKITAKHTFSFYNSSMSDDENTPPIAVGQKRSGALQLGPRKKPYATGLFTFQI
jgi:hypothetical protein